MPFPNSTNPASRGASTPIFTTRVVDAVAAGPRPATVASATQSSATAMVGVRNRNSGSPLDGRGNLVALAIAASAALRELEQRIGRDEQHGKPRDLVHPVEEARPLEHLRVAVA